MPRQSSNIGIVLATYNGAKHLQTQLHSIEAQTVLPASMVICDDGSKDETIRILEEFRTRSAFPVEIYINGASLGPTENFFHATSKCHTEYIALCDQDDIWLDKKIELCDFAIEATHPDLILHSYIDFYTNQGKLFEKEYRLPGLGLVPGRAVNPSIIWLGMSMVARKSLFENVPTMQSKWYPYLDNIRDSRPEILYIHWADLHDLLLLTRARMHGTIYLIEDVCAKHRTRDGGLTSDPTVRPGLRCIPEIEAAWETRAKPYKLWSMFCDDFGDYLADIDGEPTLSEARSYYRRWSRLWGNRATIHSERSSFVGRGKALIDNLAAGAYRGPWAGGFGRRSLIKDGLNVLGVRIG